MYSLYLWIQWKTKKRDFSSSLINTIRNVSFKIFYLKEGSFLVVWLNRRMMMMMMMMIQWKGVRKLKKLLV
jgi:hypothetical protein